MTKTVSSKDSNVAPLPTHVDQSNSTNAVARPLADRDCSQTDSAKAPPAPSTSNHPPFRSSQSHARLQRGSVNAVNDGTPLPRRGSFQGPRGPQTPAAAAAQEAYYHRKAAKLYAAKRKAAAVKAAAEETDSSENIGADMKEQSGDFIKVTVDGYGVKIDKGGSNTAPITGMGSRSNSRTRVGMIRRASLQPRQRIGSQTPIRDDKENAVRGQDVDAYFNQKRGTVENEPRLRDIGSENTPSWDGSMPRRQSSRSFIHRAAKVSTTTGNVSNECDDASRPAWKQKEECVEGMRRQRTSVEQNKGEISSEETRNIDIADSSLLSKVAEVGVLRERNKDMSKEMSAANSEASSGNKLKKEALINMKISESFKGDSTLHRSTNRTSSPGSQGLPSHSKLCDNCVGLGKHISALLAELDTQRRLYEASVSDVSSCGGSNVKKGWKNIVSQSVLGDAKSKNSSERARLHKEVAALQATVEFLYKRLEDVGQVSTRTAASGRGLQ